MPDYPFLTFRHMMAIDPTDGYIANGPDPDPEGLIAWQYQKRKRTHCEEAEELNEALNLAQRVKRRLLMKRNSARIRLGRERSSRRRASTDVLKKRAFNMAKNRIATKLLAGRNKADVGAGEKSRIEDLLKKRKKSIQRVAMKLLPLVRKKDQDKFKSKGQASGSKPADSPKSPKANVPAH